MQMLRPETTDVIAVNPMSYASVRDAQQRTPSCGDTSNGTRTQASVHLGNRFVVDVFEAEL